jgi:cysteine desulfurase
VAGIVGTATTLTEAQANREHYSKVCGQLSRQLIDGVLRFIPAARLSGHPEQRLPNNVHFSFEGAESDTLLSQLDALGIAASAGSACTSATWEPSHVLTAMGMPLTRAASVLRLTCGPENTAEEIDHVLSILPGVVGESRAKARSGLSAK